MSKPKTSSKNVTLQLVKDFDQAIYRHSCLGNKSKIDGYLQTLFIMPMKVSFLRETRICKTIQEIILRNPEFKDKANALLYKWKNLTVKEIFSASQFSETPERARTSVNFEFLPAIPQCTILPEDLREAIQSELNESLNEKKEDCDKNSTSANNKTLENPNSNNKRMMDNASKFQKSKKRRISCMEIDHQSGKSFEDALNMVETKLRKENKVKPKKKPATISTSAKTSSSTSSGRHTGISTKTSSSISSNSRHTITSANASCGASSSKFTNTSTSVGSSGSASSSKYTNFNAHISSSSSTSVSRSASNSTNNSPNMESSTDSSLDISASKLTASKSAISAYTRSVIYENGILPQQSDSSPSSELDENQTNDFLENVTTSKTNRTKVYSGFKNRDSKVPSLTKICIQFLRSNLDSIEYTGGIPYFVMKQIIKQATPKQLRNIENYNPYLIEDTEELWEIHCMENFREQSKNYANKMLSWREIYFQCVKDREDRLKAITNNIKNSINSATPQRQTKLAIIDPVALTKGGRFKNNIPKPVTTNSQKIAVKHLSEKASAVVPIPAAAKFASLSCNNNILKPKPAPLMQKALRMFKTKYQH